MCTECFENDKHCSRTSYKIYDWLLYDNYKCADKPTKPESEDLDTSDEVNTGLDDNDDEVIDVVAVIEESTDQCWFCWFLFCFTNGLANGVHLELYT